MHGIHKPGLLRRGLKAVDSFGKSPAITDDGKVIAG
jgi:hypothetical protein